MDNYCGHIHILFNNAKRYYFPFEKDEIPQDGIYILFENGEYGHSVDRIVRIGTHTGKNQLYSRITQHFLNENKDRSIFRKNIGRAILNKNNDKYLKIWEYDLTTKENKLKYQKYVDREKQISIEKEISNYIQNNFSFTVFEIIDKNTRLDLESKIISTVSLCKDCKPSKSWLGNFSTKSKIQKSGLWLVNELWKLPLESDNVKYIECVLEKG
jgi:hypothetical protein